MDENMIHLHVHTDGSTLDGSVGIKRLMAKIKEQGESSVAITDHGNMIKVKEFYNECIKENIKPIVGCEFYCGEKEDTNKYHMVLLAKNSVGLKNLYKLIRAGYDLFYTKPRISMELIEKHKEGLIALSACIGGELAQNYLNCREGQAIEFLDYMQQVFGDDFYVEIQPNAMKDQRVFNTWVSQLNMNNIVVTCDAHYVNKEDHEAHDTLLCMSTKKTKSDKKRFRFPTNDAYIMTDSEVRSKLDYLPMDVVNRAIDNTHIIASKCNVEIAKEDLMPIVGTPEEARAQLVALLQAGYKHREAQGHFKGVSGVIDRINYELKVLTDKNYCSYFVILADMYRFAKENNIAMGVGRGSAAGSEIAFVLGLTEVEPIKYGLLFERFLNPTRNSDPDFDGDICYEDRHILIEYICNKYGVDNTSHIMAEGTLAPKAVFKRVMTAHDFPYDVVNGMSKLVKEESTLDGIVSTVSVPPHVEADMRVLEGLMSHASKHAAGILIMNDRVDNHFPVRYDRDEKVNVCEWHKKHVEAVGGCKFDILGLKQLTIFKKTLQQIETNKGVKITLEDLYNLDMEDPTIYKVLNTGRLTTIFQFAGFAAGHMNSLVEPKCFDDIMAITSICRPGVKEADMYLNNKRLGNYHKPVYWEHVKDILEPTYGAIVYQEQTMQIMNRIAGWDLGKCDGMRKVKDLEEFRDDFVRCAMDNGYDGHIADTIFTRFDLGYSFNKSHACSYSKLTAICAWLLGNYPCEFLSSNLTLELTATDNNIPALLQECRNSGISILPPSLNESTNEFIAVDNSIRLPLTVIKGVGKSAYDEILEKRPFMSFEEFVNKVSKAKVKSNVVEKMIMSGVFDLFYPNRSQHLEMWYKCKKMDKNVFFYAPEVQMMYEKLAYGFYLNKHPLDGYSNADINTLKDKCSINGIIDEMKIKKDKNGNDMAFLDCSNKVCSFRAVLFASSFSKFKSMCVIGSRLSFTGKIDGGSVLVDAMRRA